MSHSRGLLDAVAGCGGVGVRRRGLSTEKHEERHVHTQHSQVCKKWLYPGEERTECVLTTHSDTERLGLQLSQTSCAVRSKFLYPQYIVRIIQSCTLKIRLALAVYVKKQAEQGVGSSLWKKLPLVKANKQVTKHVVTCVNTVFQRLREKQRL